MLHRHLPLNEPIDLLNVAFENPRKIRVQREGNDGGPNRKKRLKELVQGPANVSYMVPDRITGLQEVEEFRRLYPERTWNFVSLCTCLKAAGTDATYRWKWTCHMRCVVQRGILTVMQTTSIGISRSEAAPGVPVIAK